MSDSEREPAEVADPKLETPRDDRYAHWNDERYQSKHMQGWRGNLRFDAKHFGWPMLKWAISANFGPWPMQLCLVLIIIIYLAKKYLF